VLRNILVTGGAGYIGSHAVLTLIEEGYHPIVFDNLSSGYINNLPEEATFVQGDLGNDADLDGIFYNYSFDAVMHFAGSIVVPESITKPEKYYQNNVVNTIRLLNKMIAFNVDKLIFSSTAAIYGPVDNEVLIDETFPANPKNPYGTSKWMSEMIIRDIAYAHKLKATFLRYFNVAGADEKGRTGNSSPHATHLIKRATRVVLGLEPYLTIFGNDYPTSDGSAIRDYIHVSDLIEAHILALAKLDSQQGIQIFNCGYGTGYSVLEVISSIEQICGKSINIKNSDRRKGDAASVIASSDRIRKELGWVPSRMNIKTIIETSLLWEEKINKI
jgi:UDP-glucose 4-epimerase